MRTTVFEQRSGVLATELYVFLPGTLHDWHDVEEDTLLSACLVRQLR